jgi:TIR domain.
MTAMPEHLVPKVFVSHASEDKDRFVRRFAERLRERGIDAWVDEWEIYPGDSLVDKIFEEGLKAASVVIVVVSRFSVDKPWVREELNAGVVKRINRGGRLIPVVLDATDVPEVLKSTVWVNIPDLDSYDHEFDRIISAIYDHRPKPALGKAPAYVTSPEAPVPGLSGIDTFILRVFAEKALEEASTFGIGTEERWSAVEQSGVSREDFEDSLEVLARRGYLEASKVLAPIPPYFSLTVSGFETYLKRYDPAYPTTFRDVALAIMNSGIRNNYQIAEVLGRPQVVVNHVLRIMKMKRYVDTSQVSEGNIDVFEVGAELKRYLRNDAGG